MSPKNTFWSGVLILVLCACTARPLVPEQAARRAVTPAMAAHEPAVHQGRLIEWGGILIATHNRRDHTLLEVLAYPLKTDGRPQRERPPLGRFLAVQGGYLETLEYAPGRLVTIGGAITGTRRGRIGKGDYIYPTVDVRQLQLWPPETRGTVPRIHFGIGVGSGGDVGWGAGVGF